MLRKQLMRASRTASQSLNSSSIQQRQIISSPYSSWSSQLMKSQTPRFSQQLTRRWQSTEAAKSEPASAETAKPPEASSEDALKQEIEKQKKEILDLKDKYLRSVADYRNLQDRTTRDGANARNFAIQKFATDLLDSIDNLDRALSAVPEAALGKSPSGSVTSNTSSADANQGAATESAAAPNKDLLNLHSGLKMTEKIMMQTLEKHGLAKYDPMDREGKKFDPNLDEATFFAPQQGKNNGEVFYTQQKGFTLNGRVIRAAKVGVVKNS